MLTLLDSHLLSVFVRMFCEIKELTLNDNDAIS